MSIAVDSHSPSSLFPHFSLRLQGVSVRSWLVDYDRALSIVLHNASGARIACGDLIPNMPALPDVWSATIEANIGETPLCQRNRPRRKLNGEESPCVFALPALFANVASS